MSNKSKQKNNYKANKCRKERDKEYIFRFIICIYNIITDLERTERELGLVISDQRPLVMTLRFLLVDCEALAFIPKENDYTV